MALVEKWINVVDPVLNPVAPHVIARHYLLSDGRVKGKTPRLVLAIHGGHGHAEKMATEHLTPKPGYVIAYPSGSNKLLRVRVDGENLSWNTYSPYESGQGWAGEAGVNDELFLTSLVSKLCSEYAITKRFGVGVSRGGMMVFHLACDKALFNGIATVATTIAEPLLSCNCIHVPDIHIHGDSDNLVGWEQPSTSQPWPIAKPRITWWQNSGTGHELHVIPNGEHEWNMGGFDTTGNIWRFFDKL
jgi:poly(3-hydroxybutyrate) depolymerase